MPLLPVGVGGEGGRTIERSGCRIAGASFMVLRLERGVHCSKDRVLTGRLHEDHKRKADHAPQKSRPRLDSARLESL